MNLLKNLLLTVSFVSLAFMFVGFYKPYIMVWWEDIQNRKKVFKVYGITSLLFLILYLVMQNLYPTAN